VGSACTAVHHTQRSHPPLSSAPQVVSAAFLAVTDRQVVSLCLAVIHELPIYIGLQHLRQLLARGHVQGRGAEDDEVGT
jgi:hypothetical protein